MIYKASILIKCEPRAIKIQNHLFQTNQSDNCQNDFITEDMSLVELLNYGAFFNESTNSLSSSVIKPKITRLDDLMDTKI